MLKSTFLIERAKNTSNLANTIRIWLSYRTPEIWERASLAAMRMGSSNTQTIY